MFMRKADQYFLYPVESPDDLPPAIGEAIRTHLSDDHIHAIIVIPPQDYAIWRESRWKRNLPFRLRVTPQRTLVFGDQQIVLVEAGKDGTLNTLLIPLDCLVYANLGTILLYATLELAWASGQQIEKRFIEYNAVGERIIRRQLEWVRTQITARTPRFGPIPGNQPTVNLPFKFNNYLKTSLLPGETIQMVVHQSAIRRGDRWFSPYLSPNRTIAITDQHLIILEEEERRRKSTYGIITRFCPLDRVQQVKFRAAEELCWMYLTLGFGDVTEWVEIPLETANSDDLRQAWDTLHRVKV